jgi:Methyltransferase domain
MRRRSFLAGTTALAALPWSSRIGALEFGKEGPNAPWVPTPDEMVDIMFKLARVTASDIVCDLGSGDGRIPIIAAQKYGARGLGIEIDPELVGSAWRNAQRAGVAKRVRFVEGDVFTADFSEATVITLYLLTHMNNRLRPRFLDLRPGTRIVAHNFGMNEWDADEVVFHNETRALLWIVPAKLEGTWRFQFAASAPAERAMLTITQRYQQISGEFFFGNAGKSIRAGEIRGDRVRFVAQDATGALWSFHAQHSAPKGSAPMLRGYASDGARSFPFTARRTA